MAEGERTEAARLLGVSPRSLRYLVQKHGERAAASSDKN
jgi:DNA-binding transcriptional MerR regulator